MIAIPELFEVDNIDRITYVLKKALADYIKLDFTFPDKTTKENALEATIRFYGQYDLFYGKAYSLDEEINEVILLIDSDNADCSKERCEKAGCFSGKYKEVSDRMDVRDREKRVAFFEELERLEETIEFPSEYIYIDFLGVLPELQGEGRGRKILDKVFSYADSKNVPLILFTNGDSLVSFYEDLGFRQIGITESEKFGFTSTYLVRDPKREVNGN